MGPWKGLLRTRRRKTKFNRVARAFEFEVRDGLRKRRRREGLYSSLCSVESFHAVLVVRVLLISPRWKLTSPLFVNPALNPFPRLLTISLEYMQIRRLGCALMLPVVRWRYVVKIEFAGPRSWDKIRGEVRVRPKAARPKVRSGSNHVKSQRRKANKCFFNYYIKIHPKK